MRQAGINEVQLRVEGFEVELNRFFELITRTCIVTSYSSNFPLERKIEKFATIEPKEPEFYKFITIRVV
jgi:hypothetical protein